MQIELRLKLRDEELEGETSERVVASFGEWKCGGVVVLSRS